MKRFEIVVEGGREEETGREILEGVYGAIRAHGYTEVSVRVESVPAKPGGELWMPDFLKRKSCPGCCRAAGRR